MPIQDPSFTTSRKATYVPAHSDFETTSPTTVGFRKADDTTFHPFEHDDPAANNMTARTSGRPRTWCRPKVLIAAVALVAVLLLVVVLPSVLVSRKSDPAATGKHDDANLFISGHLRAEVSSTATKKANITELLFSHLNQSSTLDTSSHHRSPRSLPVPFLAEQESIRPAVMTISNNRSNGNGDSLGQDSASGQRLIELLDDTSAASFSSVEEHLLMENFANTVRKRVFGLAFTFVILIR
jgi:hypothetical protein